MSSSNLLYATAQVFHNFGACMVVGGSVYALYAKQNGRKLIIFILAGWILQALSGASFGLISYVHEKSFPDIGKIARGALFLKMTCTFFGILLSVLLLKSISFLKQKLIAICSITALTAAAFLRWFS